MHVLTRCSMNEFNSCIVTVLCQSGKVYGLLYNFIILHNRTPDKLLKEEGYHSEKVKTGVNIMRILLNYPMHVITVC